MFEDFFVPALPELMCTWCHKSGVLRSSPANDSDWAQELLSNMDVTRVLDVDLLLPTSTLKEQFTAKTPKQSLSTRPHAGISGASRLNWGRWGFVLKLKDTTARKKLQPIWRKVSLSEPPRSKMDLKRRYLKSWCAVELEHFSQDTR